MTQPTPSAVRAAPSTALGPYVINLCASTTPMALARPTAPELARFTFFVSRRREDGRERFRLHMGYFATRDEAEQLLSIIRDLYPAAWVGEAPGRKLAGRSDASGQHAALPAAAAAPAAAPVSAPPAAAPAAVTPPAPSTPAPAAAAPARTTPARKPAATTGAKMPPSNVREVIAALDADPGDSAATRQMPQPTLPAMASAPVPAPAAAAKSVAAQATRPAPAAPAQAATARPAAPPAPPARPAKPAARAPATPAAPAATAAGATPPRAASTTPTAPTAPAGKPAARTPVGTVQSTPVTRDELSDSQVLRILETRRASAAGQAGAQAAPGQAARSPNTDIRMLSPDDTQTWRDIKSQLSRDAAVHFAVQLEWSVAPIDLEKVPGLAIFNAYTLYKIEGNRDGRRWYGLRLGFFSDAVAARQVALYVRSEFATVAVVPVSAKERGDAMQVGAIELPKPATVAPASRAEDAIQLIDDDVDAVLSRSEQPVADPESFELSTTTTPALPEAAAPIVADAAPEPAPRRGRARAPQTLEETLEILGASQLSIDNGKGVRLDIGNAPRRGEPRNSTFSKLLDRLAEKLRN